ncbi:hypothetical protein AWB96_06850 [Mycobacteroides chelonae]|nr:hypothetical protein BKG56_08755 [Mycobacteroides chelonae]ORV15745.1 hypothetical protein AWB96_06850 [Mycobacteroides chelonae]
MRLWFATCTDCRPKSMITTAMASPSSVQRRVAANAHAASINDRPAPVTRFAQPLSHHDPALKAPSAPAAPASPNNPTSLCDK